MRNQPAGCIYLSRKLTMLGFFSSFITKISLIISSFLGCFCKLICLIATWIGQNKTAISNLSTQTFQSHLQQWKGRRNYVTALKEFRTVCGWQIVNLSAYNLKEFSLISTQLAPMANIILLQLKGSTNSERGQTRQQRAFRRQKDIHSIPY